MGIFNDIYTIIYNAELILFINLFRHILSFEMNATSPNGVVFYMASKHQNPSKSEFIALEIVDSYFRYHIKCSHLNAMLTVPRIVANDAQFHKVNIHKFI